MAATTILLDSSTIIDFFRKTKKDKSVFYRLAIGHSFSVSVITDFEIRIGLKSDRPKTEFQTLMQNIHVFPLDQFTVDEAVKIYHELRMKNANRVSGFADRRYRNSIFLANSNIKPEAL